NDRETKEEAGKTGKRTMSRNEIEADPQPIPAQRIECGFGSSCLRMRRARAFSSTDAWKRTSQTGAAYSTTAAKGSEKCAASRRAKISLPERPGTVRRRAGYAISAALPPRSRRQGGVFCQKVL